MKQKQSIRYLLLAALAVISLGGWFLHLRIHKPEANPGNWVPAVSGFLSVFIIPAMFMFKKTSAYAYVINGITVIIGTVMMSHYSIAHFHGKELTIYNILIGTLLADVALLWGKLLIGKAIFEIDMLQSGEQLKRTGRFLHYPNMGYWFVHLFAISTVYALGHLLWKVQAV